MTLTRAPALDTCTLARALAVFGAARRHHPGVRCGARDKPACRRRRASSCRAPQAQLSRAERAWLENPRHCIVPFTDPRYPALLRSAARHPIALYVAGNLDALNDPQLAIVGSRNPTAQGRETAEVFSEYLAARGLAITSGLAVGIDSCGTSGRSQGAGNHAGGAGVGGRCRLPVEQSSAWPTEIQLRGALISAFPLGSPPRREHFPQRNAIIAGPKPGHSGGRSGAPQRFSDYRASGARLGP